jgi:hypothetical protein
MHSFMDDREAWVVYDYSLQMCAATLLASASLVVCSSSEPSGCDFLVLNVISCKHALETFRSSALTIAG